MPVLEMQSNGFYPLRTTSKRIGASLRSSRPSSTPGKTKGGNCVRSELKTWGIRANPNKLRGGDADRYAKYCATTNGLNK
jgi:hypothetical protein